MKLKLLFANLFRKKESAMTTDDIIAEIQAIKTAFDTFNASVSAAISTLQGQVAAGTTDLSGVVTALDSLKSDVEGATVPTV